MCKCITVDGSPNSELSFTYRGDNIVIVVDLREGNVFQLPRNVVTTFLICACVILSGCASPKPPEVRILSDEEASELWDKAESYKPVGEAVTKTFPSSAGTIVTTSQVYSLRMSGRPGLSVVTVCGGSCQLKPGGTFGSCVTSGRGPGSSPRLPGFRTRPRSPANRPGSKDAARRPERS